MNRDIIFKCIDGKIQIIVNSHISFDQFLFCFKERLNSIFVKDELLKTNAILNIEHIKLDAKDILKIFDVLNEYGNIYISKIIYKEKINKNIYLHEGNIRGGEVKLFNSNTLLLGNINKGSKIIINGNLYVIGKVNGKIEFKNKNNKLYCSNITDSLVKFCSIIANIDGNNENCIVEIKNNEININKFIDRRDRYGKSNCSYIW